MPRKKAAQKAKAKKQPKTEKAEPVNSKSEQKFLNKWLADVEKASKDFQYDAELLEINSDDESDEFECNLKELEKPLKKLLRRFPDDFIRQRIHRECEWDKCTFESMDDRAYNNHVHDHITKVDESDLKCLWNLCKFETEDRQELLRHLDYHAYHTRMKTFGLGLVSILSVPTCHIDSKYRNVIPQTPSDYFCYWGGCSRSYTKFNEFHEHVSGHIFKEYLTGAGTIKNKEESIRTIRVQCKWEQCDREVANIYQLKRHLRTHTNEKLIGCGTCGTLFSSKPMFINHCIRQAISQRSFQCPVCSKSFPSQKILKDHGRSHVNKFQCSLCGLSWQKKSVLARHIRYRHTTERPFSCSECKYKGKTHEDLESHRSVHQGENLHRCEVFGCEYSSRTLMALKRHDAKEHLGAPQTYACHCCSKTYFRGYLLSKHLIGEHAFKLPPGHSRFIYKQDFDGLYRLQTKRVENLKEKALPVATFEEDSQVDVSYEIESFTKADNSAAQISVKINRVTRAKPYNTPTTFADESTEDSKDVNDFAIFQKYKKIIKKKKIEDK